MKPRSLTRAQRIVLLAFMQAADDHSRQKIKNIFVPDCNAFDVWEAFDQLLDMELLKVVPCVSLEIDAKYLGKKSHAT